MPLHIIQGNLITQTTEAIVNPGNQDLKPGGGVCGQIYQGAGFREMEEACRNLSPCPPGSAVLTPGFRLKARYVIHAPGPIWEGGRKKEKELLARTYIAALELAREHSIRTIAFPLISSGLYAFPRELALRTAIRAITDFLKEQAGEEEEMEVTLVLHQEDPFIQTSKGLEKELKESLRNHGVLIPGESDITPEATMRKVRLMRGWGKGLTVPSGRSFSQTLQELMEEKGLKPAEVYKAADLTRQHFHKIRQNRDYQPNRQTAMALCVALHLNLPEAEELLRTAGYTFSEYQIEDLVYRYHISRGQYDHLEIQYQIYDLQQEDSKGPRPL